MSEFCTSDQRFSAGDKRDENVHVHSNFSPTPPTHTASYQQLSNRTYLNMIATHRYSPSKMSSSYHSVILTSNYATPTSYIRNSVFWTKPPSSRLNWLKKNDKRTSPYTQLVPNSLYCTWLTIRASPTQLLREKRGRVHMRMRSD